MSSIQAHIADVVDSLKGDIPVVSKFLESLKNSQNGQIKLQSGESSEALVFFLKAHKSFKEIPAARGLLGITCADIAAAHANLGDFQDAAKFARDAISIVQGNQTFVQTEANSHMTLANALARLGQTDEAETHFDCAGRIYRLMPDGSKYLQALEHNRAIMLSRIVRKKPWWKIW